MSSTIVRPGSCPLWSVQSGACSRIVRSRAAVSVSHCSVRRSFMRPIIARARQLLFPDPARDLEIDRRRRCDLLDNALGFLPKARIIGLQIHDNAVSTQAEAADAG